MAYEEIGFIIEFAFEFIPRYFGALMKWIYLGFKIPYVEVLKQKGNTKSEQLH